MARGMARPCGMATPCPAMAPGTQQCPLTLEAGGDGEVHGPADQRHDQPQEDEEDPIFAHLGDEEPLALQGADCGHKGRLRARRPGDGHAGVAGPGWQVHKRSQLAAPTQHHRHRPVREHHRAQPSQPYHNHRWAGSAGSGCAQPHTVLPGTRLPPARPPWHGPRQRGWGPPVPAACPAILGHCVPAARRAGGIVLGAGVP